MLKSYKELRCFDFLVKPYTVDALVKTLNLVMQSPYIKKTKRAELPFKTRTGIKMLPIDDIYFIEVVGRDCTVISNNEVLVMPYVSLKNMKERLHKYGFIQSHKAFLVNPHKIKELTMTGQFSGEISFYGTEYIASLGKKYKDDVHQYIS